MNIYIAWISITKQMSKICPRIQFKISGCSATASAWLEDLSSIIEYLGSSELFCPIFNPTKDHIRPAGNTAVLHTTIILRPV